MEISLRTFGSSHATRSRRESSTPSPTPTRASVARRAASRFPKPRGTRRNLGGKVAPSKVLHFDSAGRSGRERDEPRSWTVNALSFPVDALAVGSWPASLVRLARASRAPNRTIRGGRLGRGHESDLAAERRHARAALRRLRLPVLHLTCRVAADVRPTRVQKRDAAPFFIRTYRASLIHLGDTRTHT